MRSSFSASVLRLVGFWLSAFGAWWSALSAEPAPALGPVSVTLAATPTEAGLKAIAQTVEGTCVPVTRDGREGWVCRRGEGQTKFLFFRVLDEALRNGQCPAATATVEFFDEGRGVVGLEYDSLEEMPIPGGFKPVPITVDDRRVWRTVTLDLDYVRFGGRCNGQDFRLSIPANLDFAVARVEIRGVPPAAVSVPPIAWRVVKTGLPTPDVVVAGLSVAECGAKADGRSDDTAVFQAAIDALWRDGGGTVFVPAGRYAIRGALALPGGVGLRGEWSPPAPGARLGGTILMAYAGRGAEDGPPFIRCYPNSGLQDLAIWYPEQDPEHIVPYPYCLQQMAHGNVTVERVTLVNPYNGLRFGPAPNSLHYVHDVYGSPLHCGIEIDLCADIGRLEGVHFGPEYWADAVGLAPAGRAGCQAWMRQNGTGIVFRRADWAYGCAVALSGYQTGMLFTDGPQGQTNGQFYGCTVTDCGTALDAVHVLDAGVAFSRCRFAGDLGVHAARPNAGVLQFSECSLAGRERAVLDEGRGHVSFQRCTFQSAMEVTRGSVTVLDSEFDTPAPQVVLGRHVAAATLGGNRFRGPAGIRNQSASPRVLVDPTPLDLARLPECPLPTAPRQEPARAPGAGFLVATDPPFGVRRDGGADATAGLQAALDTAGKAGGGTVFLPGGDYAVRGNLVVPSGVELRGVFDVPHHTQSRGSMLRFYAGRGDAGSPPAVVLQAGASVRGLTCMYPEQRGAEVVPYPPTIQGRGANVAILDVTAMNPYVMIDLASYRCDGHEVDYAAGSPLRTGIVVGAGSAGGEIRNCQFNPNYWMWTPYAEMNLANAPTSWQYQLGHLEAFVVGWVTGQRLLENFVYGANQGIRLVAEAGGEPDGVVLGQGVDGSVTGVQVEAAGRMPFLNAMLCPSETPDKVYIRLAPACRGEAAFFNTTGWYAAPAHAVRVEGGGLTLQSAHFLSHGGPATVVHGALSLENVLFSSSGDIVAAEPSAQPVRLIGVTTVNGDGLAEPTPPAGLPPDPAAAGARVVRRLVNSLTEPLGPDALEITAALRDPPEFRGLRCLEMTWQSTMVPVERGGRTGWLAAERRVDFNQRYACFDVDHPRFSNGAAPAVELVLEYFDEGSATLAVQYDSSDRGVVIDRDRPGAWQLAGVVKLCNTLQWKTIRLTLVDAFFGRRCHQNDIRVSADRPVDFVLGSMRITRREP